jgi:hypothetical protein
MDSETDKETVRRLVQKGIDSWDPTVFDEVFTQDAMERARRDFGSFKSSFSDLGAGSTGDGCRGRRGGCALEVPWHPFRQMDGQRAHG